MDRRIKYTKKIIKDTFLSLLSEKDIKNITVSEICKIADINRATFYRYYLDVYDLLNKIQEEFVQELKNATTKEDNNISTFSKNLLNVFLENNTKIDRNVVIRSGCRLNKAIVEKDLKVNEDGTLEVSDYIELEI